MSNYKIIKRKTGDGDQHKPVADVNEPAILPATLQREMAGVITGWIDDWRGRKQPDARSAFNDLFQTST